MKRPEILAPAGNMECLVAAVNAGCDAVYLAGKLYGARGFAGNFSNDEIIEAIKFCHLRGVLVYVTVNTIIYEREVDNFINYIRFLHQNNVDAIIIEDIGMLDLIRKKFPLLEIHASTQMHITSRKDVLFLKSIGVKRCVLAREVSIDKIKNLKKIKDIDLECFVHGALCVSYSGQCYMSTLIGNRSGNRGTCAQCCRKKYNLFDENNNKLNNYDYVLSTKDLCTLENIDKLILSGIDSLKIEGRMKRPEYVYLVTKTYKNAVDNYIKTGKHNINYRDILEMKKLFNREFTKGFILNSSNNDIINPKRPNHMGIEIGMTLNYKNGYLTIKLTDDLYVQDGIRILGKEDYGFAVDKIFINKKNVSSAKSGDIVSIKCKYKVKENLKVLLTTSNKQIKDINFDIKNNKRLVNIDLKVIAKKNDYLFLEAFDGKNKVSLKSNFKIEEAKNISVSYETLKKQFSKCGNTVYKVNNIDILSDDNIFINIKDINELRRNVLEKLDDARLYNLPFIEKEYKLTVPLFDIKRKRSVLIKTKEDLIKYKDADIIYTENKDLLNNNIIYKLPRVMYEYPSYDKEVLISQIGGLISYKKFNTDFSFNIVNSYGVAFLHSLGANIVTLSYELTDKQIEEIINNYRKRYNTNPNLEVITDGYLEAMICKFNLNKLYSKDTLYLEDERKNRYKIVNYNDYMKIYNYKKRNIEDLKKLYDIGVNYLRTEK